MRFTCSGTKPVDFPAAYPRLILSNLALLPIVYLRGRFAVCLTRHLRETICLQRQRLQVVCGVTESQVCLQDVETCFKARRLEAIQERDFLTVSIENRISTLEHKGNNM